MRSGRVSAAAEQAEDVAFLDLVTDLDPGGAGLEMCVHA
jgi:hypothetical protein